MKITSRDNQRLKQARKVRDGKIKDSVFVEGIRLTEETLRSDVVITEVFFAETFAENERGKSLLDKFSTFETDIFEVSDQIFGSLSDTKNSQGVVLIAEKPQTGKEKIEANITKDFQLVLLLHEVNNPSNLGAILRTAEAAGVGGVILTKNSANAFSPKTVRASMGAVFRVPIWENADFSEVLSWAKNNYLQSICADVRAEKSYTEINWKKQRLLIFGSEAHGLNLTERNEIEESLVIPMENEVESLNLAVSCGIILFEAKRQREN